MPRPFMVDSGADPERGYSDAIQVTLAPVAPGKYRLELAPDLAWLQSPERAYPVRLDPTVEQVVLAPDGSVGKDAPIYQGTPDGNFAAHGVLDVGKRLDGLRRDSLLEFVELDTLPQDSVITRANMWLNASSGTNGMTTDVYHNTSAWDEATVTWNTRPAAGNTRWTSRIMNPPRREDFYLTKLVDGWVRGTIPNYGLRVISTGAAGENVAFDSSDALGNRPELEVRYVPATRLGVDDLWEYASQDHGGGNSSSVNTSTGNLVFEHDGGAIAARGFDVDLSHTYNSQDAYGQTAYFDRAGAVYGEGWTFSQNIRLYEVDGGWGVVFKDGSGGANRVYAKHHDTATERVYIRPLYYGADLTKDLSATADPKRIWKLAPDSSREVTYFDGGGKIRRIQDPNGNFLEYAYDTDATSIADPNGKLASITDVAGRKTLFEYAGTPARLSKMTDMAGRVSTYAYDADGDLTTIKHGVTTNPDGTTSALETTTLGYGVAHHLINDTVGELPDGLDRPRSGLCTAGRWARKAAVGGEDAGPGRRIRPSGEFANSIINVTNPRGHKSHINYKVEDRWDAAPDTEGYRAEGAATAVSQDGTRAFRGAGSLRLDISNLSGGVLASAARVPAAPESWNSVQQELVGFVYVPAGAQLQARLMLRDKRGRQVYGPWWAATAGTWTQIRMPAAHLDPAYQVGKAAVQFQIPAGAPAYTGSAWVDNVMVRGVAESLTDSKPAPVTTARLGYAWDSKTTTVSVPDQSGAMQASKYVYDRDGQVTQATDPLGNSDTATYDQDLRLTSATGPDNRTSRLSYYPNSNEVRTVTSPTGQVARSGVDLATGDVRYEIDPSNEERRSKGLDYVAAVYAYDAVGNPTSAQVNRYPADADPATVDLDAAPLPAPVATLRKTGYTYGAGGVMASMTDPNGNVTGYSYQAGTGYMTGMDSPAGTGETSRRVVAITPNPDGSLQSDVDAKGQKTTYEYDGLGGLVKISYGMQDGVADSSVSYTLDPNGNATAMTDGAGSSSWTYDENDQLTGESRTQGGQTRAASYAYYPNGELSTLTTLEGGAVSFGYDALGRVVSQTDPKDGGRAIAFAYDRLSRPTSTTFPSGVSQRLSYGPDDNLRQVLLQRPDGTAMQRFDYEYGADPVTGAPAADYWDGFVRGVTELDGSRVSYGYDELGRLTSAVRTGANPYNEAYAYDGNDNRTAVTKDGVTTTATYDAADQMVSQGTTSYRYDRNGNLLSGGQLAYSYDASDKTAGVTGPTSSLTFGYDGEGRRVSRTVGAARTDYWYDATGMALETGASSAAYLRSPDGALLSIASGGSTYNYGADRLNNITALVAPSGTLAAGYGYKPYGEQNGVAGTAYNPYRYTGTYQDMETGLYQMGARYYNENTEAFTQQDPLPTSIFEGQRYGYTPGNPANFTDPTGLYCTSVGVSVNGLTAQTRSSYCLMGSVSPRALGRRTTSGSFGPYRGNAYAHYGRTCSFSADTTVATPEGEKPIADLAPGDEVLAYNEQTGEVGTYAVTDVWVHEDEVIEHLEVGGEAVETTPEHPFYTRERGWVAAGFLREGEHVRQADGGYAAVELVRLLRRTQPMYNLTVDKAHTYFIGDGQLLVHNRCQVGGSGRERRHFPKYSTQKRALGSR